MKNKYHLGDVVELPDSIEPTTIHAIIIRADGICYNVQGRIGEWAESKIIRATRRKSSMKKCKQKLTMKTLHRKFWEDKAPKYVRINGELYTTGPLGWWPIHADDKRVEEARMQAVTIV